MPTIGQIWPRNSGGGGGSDPRVVGVEDFADTIFDPSFAFTYSGTPWARASDAEMFTGVASLKSNPIGNSAQTSCFVDFTVPSGKIGMLTVAARVSSESPTFDYLRVVVDSVIVQSNIGGNPSPWVIPSHRVLAGAHIAEFRYQKDVGGTGGFDAAYIDSLAVVLHDT